MINISNALLSFFPAKLSPQHHADKEDGYYNEECYKKPGKTAYGAPLDEAKGGPNYQYNEYGYDAAAGAF